MEKLITRMGFIMIIVGLIGLSNTASAQQGTDQEYNDLFDDVSNCTKTKHTQHLSLIHI